MGGSRRRNQLATLAILGLLGTVLAEPAYAWTTRYGHVRAPDGRLMDGCHHYPYRYVVKPPSGDWLLQTNLDDPRGRHRGSEYFMPGSDPRRGRSSFDICRTTVVPGRFTIRAELTWYTQPLLPTDPPVAHHRWFEPAHFRLSR